MTAVDVFSATKDVVLAAAAIVGAVVAWRGLETWKRQLKGGVEYELARRLLRCTYLYRDALTALRHPAMFASEMPSPPDAERASMNRDQIRHYGTERAYQARWDRVVTARTNLQTEILEAEVLWGRSATAVFKPAFDLQGELFGAIYMYLRMIDPNEDARTRESLGEAYSKKRDVMYDLSGAEPDEFSRELGDAIVKVEEFVKPHLQT